MTAYAALLGAVVGAVWSTAIPVVVVIGAVAMVLVRRHPLPITIAFCLVVSWAGDRAVGGLAEPDAGAFVDWVTLVDDPRPVPGGGVSATVRHEGRLLTAGAHGRVAGRFDDALAGEQLHVEGTIRPLGSHDSWSRWRHVVGRITVDVVVSTAPAPPTHRVANGLRRTLAGGADALPEDDRALFLGMVIGDDRGQSPTIADDFRAAGLGHLLVVSGQNVAFVLALASPLASRLRPGHRLVGLLFVLALFAVLTRFEPSVLRAVTMAGVGVASTALGFPIDGRRTLAWAVAVLLVVDPFLVHVVAFRLSVAATAGIVWLAGPLAERMPGPRAVALAFATTAAAQIAVSPVLLATFGPLPLASLPANLLAGPASGPVMMWGATAGFAAGIVGGPIATAVHLPTRVLLWWVRTVAHGAALAPAAMLGAAGIAVLAVAIVFAFGPRARWRLAAVVLASGVALTAVRWAPHPSTGLTTLSGGLVIWRTGPVAVLVLDDPARPRTVLETTRLAGVPRPDLVVALDGDHADAEATIALRDRYGALPTVAPPMHRVPGARSVGPDESVEIGGIRVTTAGTTPDVIVELTALATGESAVVGGR